ncbi:hypothetical protein QZM38_13875 [Burkholderia orbicola]|uniref:hypothetical protein n=1 Tax=Burkholderia orbicola TaxID=2978683 RepID=UPI0026554FB5|nr:hypothetical protein [Burkholderia orbicola]MDN7481914.1 hypothetical protein [Burkholderia orbicola]
MDELNAAPSSTEPAEPMTDAEREALPDWVKNGQPPAQGAGGAVMGESASGAPVAADANSSLSQSNENGTQDSLQAAADIADAPAVAASGEASATSDANASAPESSELPPGTSAADVPPAGPGEDPNADASAAAGLDPASLGSAQPASTAGTSSPIAANSLDSLPSHIAQHLEAIYEIAVDHVRQLAAPGHVAKAELAVEIDDLLHKLSNGIAVSDGRIVAKLAALRAML